MTLIIYYPNKESKTIKNVEELTFNKSQVVFKKKNVKSNFTLPVWYFDRIEIEG